jgi:hypothetical protein
MAMTKRDYEEVADAISVERRIVSDGNFSLVERAACEETLDRVTRRLALRLGGRHNNFDPERFLVACQVPLRPEDET